MNMGHAKDISTENLGIQDLLTRYLASRKTLKSSAAETSLHLDDDSLATFIEGSLSQRELAPVAGHLVECHFCLHKTAELVRLDLELADAKQPMLTGSEQPARISTVLSELFSKIFGSNEGAVFAHQEKSETDEPLDDEKADGDRQI